MLLLFLNHTIYKRRSTISFENTFFSHSSECPEFAAINKILDQQILLSGFDYITDVSIHRKVKRKKPPTAQHWNSDYASFFKIGPGHMIDKRNVDAVLYPNSFTQQHCVYTQTVEIAICIDTSIKIIPQLCFTLASLESVSVYDVRLHRLSVFKKSVLV